MKLYVTIVNNNFLLLSIFVTKSSILDVSQDLGKKLYLWSLKILKDVGGSPMIECNLEETWKTHTPRCSKNTFPEAFRIKSFASKACVPYFLSIFSFFSPNDSPSKTIKDIFKFHWKGSFCSWDIQIFVIFSPPFHTFQIQKDKWKWQNLWCHELACINL